MSDRTGMAVGNLKPIIYFCNQGGHIVLAAHDEGDASLARKQYQEIYKPRGYQWCEADSWPEWTQLQKRLVEQEERARSGQHEALMERYDTAAKRVRDALYQRMVSSDCSNYEREFIQGWLQLKEEKRQRYEELFRQHHNYLWAVEQNSGRKIDDRMRGDNAL